MAIIGIDLGTTNSLVGVWRNGRAELIPNAFGEMLTPSIVGFDEENRVFVGKIAKEMLITNPQNTFREFKRRMGTEFQFVTYTDQNHEYSAEDLSAYVLQSLKKDAENYLHEEVTEAVISVPAYFNDNQRAATRRAGRLAGLKVERLINEPSAASLAYMHTQDKEHQVFVVFDFGGGTLDVSIVDAFENIVEIQAVSGDNQLGGKDFNEVIAQCFYYTNGLRAESLTEEERAIVYKEAELTKIALSDSNEVTRKLMLHGKEYEMSMSNRKLIELSARLFQRMTLPLQHALNDSGFGIEDVDKVILVGGSSKMPVVRSYIHSLFKNEVVSDSNQDEIVGMGAAIVAGMKARDSEIKDVILSDICPFTLGIEVIGGRMAPIIARNEILPSSREEIYGTTCDFQKRIEINIYQGEDIAVANNTFITSLDMEIPPAPAGRVGVKVRFTYDINGIFDIDVACLADGQILHKSIVNSRIELDEQTIAQRIQELSAMKIHPRNQDENRLIIAQAQRMYCECNEEQRVAISNAIHQFQQVLDTQQVREIKKAYVRFSIFLAMMEKNKFHFAEFDASFWKEEDET